MARKPANNPGTRREFVIHDRDREPLDLENPLDEPAMRETSWEDDIPKNEILQLLAKIGQRLQKSEEERARLNKALADYRDMVDALESKSEQSEKIFLTLQDKLAKQESAEENLRRRQDELEQKAKEQAERIEKAAALADKIEEAMEQQTRLKNRLDKITQDKARFIRKLERIEETVAETQTALQSKAMVLLTDQGSAKTPGLLSDLLPSRGDAAIAAEPRERVYAFPWQDALEGRSGIIFASLVALGVIAGLAFAGYQAMTAAPGQTPAVEQTASSDISAPAPLEQQSAPDASPSNSIDSAGLQPAPRFEQSQPAPAKDAEAMTEGERLQQFEQNPDELAAALNNIEPGSTPEPSAAAPEEPEPPKAEAKPEPAPVRQAEVKPVAASEPVAKAETLKAPEKTAPVQADQATPADSSFDVAGFVASQTPKGALTDRLKPDPALPEAAKKIEQQAFNGVPEAEHDLAAIYTSGRNGVPVDYTKAAAWFLEAATHNISNAQYNLGVLYHQGMGVTKNTELAFNWYRAAAARNHPEAQYNLGIAHIEGEGARYDPRLATRYFKRAAQQGVMEASYNLGLIYENGLLGQPQPNQALYWYRTAANQGSPEGKAAMNQLARGMKLSPQQIDTIYNDVKASEKSAGVDIKAKDIPIQDQTLPAPGKRADAAAVPVSAEPQTAAPMPVSNATPTAPADPVVVAQIQEQLIRLGLFPGPANGVINPVTEDAIRAYQRQSALPQDGRASQALLVNMLSSELSKPRKTASARKPKSPPIQPEALRPEDMGAPETMQD